MATLPKCYGCEKCNIWKATCDVYPSGIPKDITNETIDCNHYIPEHHEEDSSDDLPIAKGR